MQKQRHSIASNSAFSEVVVFYALCEVCSWARHSQTHNPSTPQLYASELASRPTWSKNNPHEQSTVVVTKSFVHWFSTLKR